MKMSRSFKITSKQYDSLIDIIGDRNTTKLYIDSMASFIDAYRAIALRRYANVDAYKLSIKTFNDEYGFSYNVFIDGSYEHYIAKAYVLLVIIALKDKCKFRVIFDTKGMFINKSIIESIRYIYSEWESTTNIQSSIFHLELFCDEKNIKLEYFVDLFIKNSLLTRMSFRYVHESDRSNLLTYKQI